MPRHVPEDESDAITNVLCNLLREYSKNLEETTRGLEIVLQRVANTLDKRGGSEILMSIAAVDIRRFLNMKTVYLDLAKKGSQHLQHGVSRRSDLSVEFEIRLKYFEQMLRSVEDTVEIVQNTLHNQL